LALVALRLRVSDSVAASGQVSAEPVLWVVEARRAEELGWVSAEQEPPAAEVLQAGGRAQELAVGAPQDVAPELPDVVALQAEDH
jgi:hypothetical protein